MEKIDLLIQREKEIIKEIEMLDKNIVQKYELLKNELYNVNLQKVVETKKNFYKVQTDCEKDGGHAWALLDSTFVADHKSYTDFNCLCVACGKDHTANAKTFGTVIKLYLPGENNMLMSSYMSKFFLDIYQNLKEQKKMSKQEIFSHLKSNEQLFSDEFEIYYAKAKASQAKINK